MDRVTRARRWSLAGGAAVAVVGVLVAGVVWNLDGEPSGALLPTEFEVASTVADAEANADAVAIEVTGVSVAVVGPLGDERLLGELCETSACVADLILLPDLLPLEAAVDIEVAPTLGALSIERVWTGGGAGIFGKGWTSSLDVALDDGVLTGPVGGRPTQLLGDDGIVELSDGSQVGFADGQPVSFCGMGMLCTNIEWGENTVRLAAGSAEQFWVELELSDGVVETVRAWDGRTVEYDYVDDQLVLAGHTVYSYDEGRLVDVDDGFTPRSFTYVDGTLVEATDRDRSTWSFEVTDDGVSVSAPALFERSYVFDADKRLTMIVDDDHGTVLSRTYVGAALIGEERPLDAVVTAVVEPGVVAVEQASDLAPPRRVTHRYDERGRLAETVEAGISTSYAYDETGRLDVVSHAGGETHYEYDERGLLASTVDPDGHRIEITRLPNGSISAIADDDTRTEMDYDSRGRPIAQRDGTLESRARYSARGEVVSTTDPGGATTAYAYDQAGLLLDTGFEPDVADSSESIARSVGADGGITVLEASTTEFGSSYRYSDGTAVLYDRYGRPTSVETAFGRIERRTYDDAGRVATLEGFDGLRREMSYTAGGRLSTLESDGDVYEFEWSGDRLVGLEGPLGLEVSYEWNPSGLLASTNANGLEWTYSYDDEGNLTRVDTPHGAVEATWENGLPLTLSGPDGLAQTIEWIDGQVASLDAGEEGFGFDYDSEGRVVAVSNQDGEDLETYAYDLRGRMVSATLDGEQIDVRYDDVGIESIAFGDTVESWTRSGADLESVSIDGESYDLEWLAPGLLESVSLDGDELIEIATDSDGRITSIATGDEVAAEFSWSAGLASATIGDDTASVERNSLGLTERFTSGDFDYRAEYDGAALRSFGIDDVEIGYELAGGDVSASTFQDGADTVRIDWENGSRVESFSSSEGAGTFEYGDTAVSEIRYDDRVRAVEFDDDGRATADGTGQEFLDDLFFDDGRPSLGAALPAQTPSIPSLQNLLGDIGFSLPQPVIGSHVVDAVLLVATPVVPSPIVAGGTDALVGRAISTALGMAGPVGLAVDPVRSIEVAPLGAVTAASDVLSAAPTFVVAASVLDRLGPDSSIVSRVFGGVTWAVGRVGDGLTAVARFASTNPITRAIGNVAFVGLAFVAAFCPPGASVGCDAGVHFIGRAPQNIADASSPLDFLQRAVVAPIRSFFADLLRLDVGAWVTLVLSGVKAKKARAVGGQFVGCAKKPVKCVRTMQFVGAVMLAKDAFVTDQPNVLAIDRSGVLDRARDALRGVTSTFGQTREPYTPAYGLPAGPATSLQLIDPAVAGSAAALLEQQSGEGRFSTSLLVLEI